MKTTFLFQFLNVAPSTFNSKCQRKRSPKTLCASLILSRQMPSSKGLGENGVMILPGDMQDRSLMRKLLLLGRSELTLAKAVDHLTEIKNGKRRRLRPPQAKVLQVFQTAFSLYPRLGQVNFFHTLRL